MIGTIIKLALEERQQLIKNDDTVVNFSEEERERMQESLINYPVSQRKKVESTLSRIKQS